MTVSKAQQAERAADLEKFSTHKDEIRKAAEQAKATISEAAGIAAKVISEAAAVSVKVLHDKNADDHDLLMQLKTAMEFIRSDIKDLTNGVTQKIANLEVGKADKKEFDALADEIHGSRERRMRDIENAWGKTMIYVILISLSIGGLFTVVLSHILK